MIKRPLDPRFSGKVKAGIKITTIRDKEWPVGVPIMLYNWSGKPYRSKHKDVAAVKVTGFWPMRISRSEDDEMSYSVGMENERQLFETEGFNSQEEMDEWFRPLVKPNEYIYKALMRFSLSNT